MLADVAELAGERVRRLAGRLAEELERARSPVARARRRRGRPRPGGARGRRSPRSGSATAGRGRRRARGAGRRPGSSFGEVDEEQVLEPGRRRGGRSRETPSANSPSSASVRRAPDRRLDGRQRGRDRAPRAGGGRPRRSRDGRPRGGGSGRGARPAAAGAVPACDPRSAGRRSPARRPAGAAPARPRRRRGRAASRVSPRNGIRSMSRRVWHVRGTAGRGQPRPTISASAGATASGAAGRPRARSMRRRSSSPAGSNSYDQRADALGPAEPRVEPVRDRLARQQDDVGRPVDQVEIAARRRSSPTRARRRSCPTGPASRRCSRRRASEAQTSPTREPDGRRGDLVDELEVARPDEHRDDRHPAVDERLGLVGVERRRGDEVVVEPVEPLGQVVEQRALDVDQVGERVAAAARAS